MKQVSGLHFSIALDFRSAPTAPDTFIQSFYRNDVVLREFDRSSSKVGLLRQMWTKNNRQTQTEKQEWKR